MGVIKNLINSFSFKGFELIKEDSELERKVEVLRKLNKDFPNDKKIKNDLLTSSVGLKGEKEIIRCLKNSNIGMYVLHDITLKSGDVTAQIDYVVITPAKCYLIECKNFKGNIVIDSNGQFIRKYELNGVIKEESIESPLSQAERHREILLKTNDNKSLLNRLFFDEKLFEDYHKTLVVLTNNSAVLNKDNAPQKCKDLVIRSDELINYIKEDLNNTKLIDRDYKKAMKDYAYSFMKKDNPTKINYEKIYSPKCPNCDGYLVRRKKFTEFYGCSNYPKCKYTKKIFK